MPFYEKNNTFGQDNEILVLPIITKYFDKDIKKIKDKYSTYDYEDNDTSYELKSRRNTKNKYPTTMICMNKTQSNQNIIFIFNFEDCLTYIKYDKPLFDTFEKKKFSRNYNKKDERDYVYIPIEHLSTIRNYSDQQILSV